MESGYKIERKITSSGNWSLIGQTGPSVITYYDSSATGSESYDYRIRAFTAQQTNAPYSSTVTILNNANQPINVSAVALPTPEMQGGNPGNKIRVTWSAPPNQKAGSIDHYRVKVVYPDVEWVCVPCPPPQNLCCYWDDVVKNYDTTATFYRFCAPYTNFDAQVTVYVVATGGIVGRPSQTVIVHTGMPDVTSYIAPPPPPPGRKTAGDNVDLPDDFSAKQNYPNPFNLSTQINFTVTQPDFVELSIYNVLGARVVDLFSQQAQPGMYTVTWDGRDAAGNCVASGVYFYRLRGEAQGTLSQKKMLLLK